MASIAERAPGRRDDTYVRWHFPVATTILLLLSLVAFWDNLVSDVSQPSNSNPVMAIHGLFLLAWMMLLVSQAVLKGRGRIALHRRIGPWAFGVGAGVVLSTVMLFASVWKGWAAMTPEVLAYRILLPSFAACLVLAYRNRFRPDWHKHLVYCGTLLLLEPVLARTFDPIVAPFLPVMAPGEDMPIFYGYMIGTWTAFFAALLVFDWKSFRRAHPVTLASLAWLYLVYAVAFTTAPVG